MARWGRFLVVVTVLLALAGGLLLTDYNIQQLQGGERVLQLDSKKIRGAAVSSAAAAAGLLDNCRSFLKDARQTLEPLLE